MAVRRPPPRSHPAASPLFDSLRGFAAISILFVHVAIFTGGFGDTWHGRIVSHLDIGVPFFFLLSAFLLYRPFVAARATDAPGRRSRATPGAGSCASLPPTGRC